MIMQIRNAIVVIILMCCLKGNAASAYWTDIFVQNNVDFNNAIQYGFGGDIYGENNAYSWIFTQMFGHMESDGLHLKQKDFSQEWMNATFNWWAIVAYGEIVNEVTFHDATKQVELFYNNDKYTGGTVVENYDDFYMAFKVSEVLLEGGDYVAGQSWYGWVHVSVDDTDLKMTLLGSGINLYGGAVTVGAIPEPVAGLLLLVGGAALALRRRRRSP